MIVTDAEVEKVESDESEDSDEQDDMEFTLFDDLSKAEKSKISSS